MTKMYIFQSCYFCSFPETLAGICGLHCEALRRRVSGYFLMLSPVVILRRAGRGFPCHDFGIPFCCVERIQRCILLAQEVSHGFSMHVLDDCLLNLMTERLSKDPKAAAKRRSISLMQSAYMPPSCINPPKWSSCLHQVRCWSSSNASIRVHCRSFWQNWGKKRLHWMPPCWQVPKVPKVPNHSSLCMDPSEPAMRQYLRSAAKIPGCWHSSKRFNSTYHFLSCMSFFHVPFFKAGLGWGG